MSRESRTRLPPYEPGHEREPRRPRSLWETYGIRRPVGLLVVAAVALLAITGLVIAYVPRLGPGGQLPPCRRNLRRLGSILVSEQIENGWPDRADARLLIEWRRRGIIPFGNERWLICSLDQAAITPRTTEQSAVYDDVDLEDLEALVPLCSYAVRDFARFPVDDDGTDPETGRPAWVMCDRQGPDGRTHHHPNGLNVVFADGSARFMSRGLLGIGVEERVIVGPDSLHPELRKMVFLPVPVPVDGDSER